MGRVNGESFFEDCLVQHSFFRAFTAPRGTHGLGFGFGVPVLGEALSRAEICIVLLHGELARI